MSAGVSESDSTMGVLLLGTLEVRVHGNPLPITATQQRVVLAALALAGGRPVTADRLLGILWPEEIPATARTALHNIIRRLRASFAEAGASELIATGPEGYRLDLPPEALDTEVFAHSVLKARSLVAADRPEPAAAAFREALDLWRGDPLPDLVGGGWLGSEVERLVETRIAATEEWSDLELRIGNPDRALEALLPMAAAWPFRESLRARLMLALQACGRTADALAEYVQARQLYVEELGVEPGPLLRDAHARVLRLDAEAVESADRPQPWSPTTPAMLPPASATVVGRADAIGTLDAHLDAHSASTWVVSGPAGGGKSTLALWWARRVMDRFPDGQLFINLRGFDPHSAPVSPDEAVRVFLGALGVPPDQIPYDSEAALGAYRTLVADRRLLVLLDNARDAEQVRPLLPSGPGSLAMVTSRNELASLAVTDGARFISLDLLDPESARALLVERLGEPRLREDPAAVAEILSRCGGLPLALAVAAARVAAGVDQSLTALAHELRTTSSLDVLRLGDPRTDVRSVLSWSGDALDPVAARLLRLLGLSPTPELLSAGMASLAGLPLRETGVALAALVRAHLLTDLGAGRYAVHDLVREHARELAEVEESPEARAAAVRRFAECYLHSAHTATRRQFNTPLPFELAATPSGVTMASFDSTHDALAWLAREHHTLLAMVELCAATPGLEGYGWQLARTLNGNLWDRQMWHDMLTLHQHALAGAERAGDKAGIADSLHALGDVHAGLQHWDQGQELLHQSLSMFQELGDLLGEGDVQCTLGRLFEGSGRAPEAIHHTNQALAIARVTGDRLGEAVALNNLGWLSAQLGDYAASLRSCTEAVAIYREVGDPSGESYALDSAGRALAGLGDLGSAITHYAAAADLSESVGHTYNRAQTLTHLGESQHAVGDLSGARASWTTALALFEDLGHRTAPVLRSRLALLPDPGTFDARRVTAC